MGANGKEMSAEIGGKMIIECPRCGQECEGEAPKKPWWFHFECECGYEFAYDSYREEHYNMNGNAIKEE